MKTRIFLGLILLLCSCIKEDDENIVVKPNMDASYTEVNSIVMEAGSFICEDGVTTRTSAGVNESGVPIYWAEGDVVGIFPSTGDQVSFPMEDGAGSSSASFNGGGWALKNSSTYYAYYPFSRANFDLEDRKNKIPYSYLGQKALYEVDGIVQIGSYDYMYASASTPEDGGVSFQFNHLGALIRMAITFPETATYTSLKITASEDVFPVEGTFDLTAAPVVLNPTTTSSTIAIDLENLSATKGESRYVYFMMPPLSSSTIPTFSATLIDSDLRHYGCILEKKNIEAGKTYAWIFSEAVYTDLSGDGTSNCYIISAAGAYKFKATHKGNSTSDEDRLEGINSVEVLWESFGTDETPEIGDLIRVNTSIDEYGFITLRTNEEFKEGNAVIAVRAAVPDDSPVGTKGEILWSWHIWLTDAPRGQIYLNDVGTMLDRNLGATSANPGDTGTLGLLYQWGRKDPFLGALSLDSSVEVKSVGEPWPAAEIKNRNNKTIIVEYATKNPMTFIAIASNLHETDWWCSETTELINTELWNSTKTIYDPCPPGYKVPDGGEGSTWFNAFGIKKGITFKTPWPKLYCSENDLPDYWGYDFGNNSLNEGYAILTDESTCWYPLTGFRGSGGELNARTDYFIHDYWSYIGSPYKGNHALTLSFKENGEVARVNNSTNRTRGNPVRCLKEE